MQDNDRPPPRVLRGIRAIAGYTGETYRQAQWRVEAGYYPVRRVGKIVEALTSEIDEVRRVTGAQSKASQAA
jgi:hypothetical protein